MNLEPLQNSILQRKWSRNPALSGQAALHAGPNRGLVAQHGNEGEDKPPESSLNLATTEAYTQATAGITNIVDQYPVCQSPEASDSESDSGSSMNKNAGNLTPSKTPPQAESPGPVTGIGRLSLDNTDSDNRAHNQRGRVSAPGFHSVSSKRAASSELPPRENPPSPRQNASSRGPGPGVQSSVRGPSKQKGQLGPRQSGPRGRFASQRGYVSRGDNRMRFTARPENVEHGDSRPAFDTYRNGTKSRQPIQRDSGYETMPSRQNTFQQPLANPSKGNVSLTPSVAMPQVEEESKGIITRLAGPVPVLVDSRYPKLIMQPESSPISQDQLAAEVKGIYGGLVMVEAKCINIDAAQAADPDSKLGPEQWQALIALHRTLLYEHHDFLMATQHPSATPALSGLAQKYSMPARMWRHGIHAFLEVLRHRRPQSQDYMLAFIYLAYQMMALLFETVPAFTDTWIECLGDLARYRMAIEEEKEAHTIWGGVAARWYNLASDRHPAIGRLYHHLGILERPSLRKLFLYAKSLSCVIPFPNARDSLATLCGPIVQDKERTNNGIAPAEASIVMYHAYLFSATDTVMLSSLSAEVLSQLDHLASPKLRDVAVPLLVTNIAALYEFGSPSNQLWACFSQAINASIHASRPSAAAFPALNKGTENQSDPWPVEGTSAPGGVYEFCYSSFQHIMYRGKDRQSLRDVLPAAHTILVWLFGLYKSQPNSDGLDNTLSSLLERFSWGELSGFLNTLIQYEPINARTYELVEAQTFPGSEVQDNIKLRPLSEDYLIRGLIWCHSYFPEKWFSCQAEDDGRFFETPAMHKMRVERVQWLGLSLAQHTGHITFDKDKQRFLPSTTVNPLDTSVMETSLQHHEPTKSNEYADEHRRSSTPKSRSSPSMYTDSEGYTVVNTSKSGLSYAKVVSPGYHEPTIVDYDYDMAE